MKRFNILPAGMSQGKSFRRIEHEFGEWVRWDDHEKGMYQQSDLQRVYDNKEFELWKEKARQQLKDDIWSYTGVKGQFDKIIDEVLK